MNQRPSSEEMYPLRTQTPWSESAATASSSTPCFRALCTCTTVAVSHAPLSTITLQRDQETLTEPLGIGIDATTRTVLPNGGIPTPTHLGVFMWRTKSSYTSDG
jgi:hypothetical protein